jgi:hypothetical protein
MNTKLLLAAAGDRPNGGCFRIRCEAGDDNRFGVHAESLTVTVGQHVLRNGAGNVGFGEHLCKTRRGRHFDH